MLMGTVVVKNEKSENKFLATTAIDLSKEKEREKKEFRAVLLVFLLSLIESR